MVQTETASQTSRAPLLNRYSLLDSQPLPLAWPAERPEASVARLLRLPPKALDAVTDLGRDSPTLRAEDVAKLRVTPAARDRIRRLVLTEDDTRLGIVRVEPVGGRIMSDRAFAVSVGFVAGGAVRPVLIRIVVEWAGESFVVEHLLRPGELASGSASVPFRRDQSLPSGPSTFHVSLFGDRGAEARSRTTCFVLPSNPLALWLSPTTSYVSGSYSLRGRYDADDRYRTNVRLALSNGDASAVSMSRAVGWKFWDGGVGGTLVESGTHTWSSSITVPAYGVWNGTLIFTSPPGSGIYNTYDRKEDMTLEINMISTSGVGIANTITARVMLDYGINVIRVASDTFVGQEYSDLYAAVDVTNDISEARDVTIGYVDRYHIPDADAGGYGVINSESECRDLFEDWSVSGTSRIDTFVSHDFSGTGFDGLAGDIPGPESHSGRESGVAVDKTGFVDSAGTRRLSVAYLGMLIGHELGHYLGLSHIGETGNLMLSSSGTNDTTLNYDQYRTMSRFSWIFVQ